MANLISNLQGCLDFFTLPDIQYEEHDGYFVRSAITTDIVRVIGTFFDLVNLLASDILTCLQLKRVFQFNYYNLNGLRGSTPYKNKRNRHTNIIFLNFSRFC